MPRIDDDATGARAPAAVRPSTAERPSETDGRRRRSQRSRAAIAQAMLELLRSGHASPSSAEIADRAGVTQRTLFNQFGDMASLVRTVMALQAERVVDLLPDAGHGSPVERLERFSTQLAALLEDTMHVRWAVVTAPEPSPELLEGIRGAHGLVLERLERGFPDELAALAPDRRAEVDDVLGLLADPAVWRLRRIHHGRSPDEALVTLRRALADLLDIDA